jgi:hypothetical protein
MHQQLMTEASEQEISFHNLPSTELSSILTSSQLIELIHASQKSLENLRGERHHAGAMLLTRLLTSQYVIAGARQFGGEPVAQHDLGYFLTSAYCEFEGASNSGRPSSGDNTAVLHILVNLLLHNGELIERDPPPPLAMRKAMSQPPSADPSSTRVMWFGQAKPLFAVGDRVQLVGEEVLHLPTGRAARRSDGLCGRGEVVRVSAGSDSKPGGVVLFDDVPAQCEQQKWEEAPLAAWIMELCVWVREHLHSGRLSVPPKPLGHVAYPITQDSSECGLYARRSLGLVIKGDSVSRRRLAEVDLEVIRPLMERLGMEAGEGSSKLIIGKPELGHGRAHGFVVTSSHSHTEEEKLERTSRGLLGFDLRAHALVAGSDSALEQVETLERDMKHYDRGAPRTRPRLRSIGEGFEHAITLGDGKPSGGGPRGATSISWCDSASKHVHEALLSASMLLNALEEEETTEVSRINHSEDVLLRLANFVPTLAAARAEDDEDTLRRARCFEMRRLAGHEANMDFLFMVYSLRSPDDCAVWREVNPFLSERLQRELAKMVPLIMMRTTALIYIRRLRNDAEALVKKLKELVGIIEEVHNELVSSRQDGGLDRFSSRSLLEMVHTNTVSGSIGGVDTDTLHGLRSQADAICRSVVNQANVLARALHVRPHLKLDDEGGYDPHMLFFEYMRTLTLREAQVQLVKRLTDAIDQDGCGHSASESLSSPHSDGETPPAPPRPGRSGLAQQMLMGEGKTSVIMPLLCLILADGDMLPIACFPIHLLEAGRRILQESFTALQPKLVRPIEVDRASKYDESLERWLNHAHERKGIIVTTPPSVKSILLKFIEKLSDVNRWHKGGRKEALSLPQLDHEICGWARVISRFTSSGVLLLDELDLVTQ